MMKNSFLISAVITPNRPLINSKHKINMSLAPEGKKTRKNVYLETLLTEYHETNNIKHQNKRKAKNYKKSLDESR